MRSSSIREVVILGGGISGLALAYYVERAARQEGLNLHVWLLEKQGRLGGVIATEQREGFLLERGPEAFVAFKPAAVRLIRELGLSTHLVGSRPESRKTWLLEGDRLVPLPGGVAFLAPVRLWPFLTSPGLSLGGKLRALLEPFVPPSRRELSVRAFLQRRLGSEFTSRVGEPLVSAIYGGDIDQLSAPAALSEAYRAEQESGSLWKGFRARGSGGRASGGSFFLTLREGMEELVRGVVGNLSSTTLLTAQGDIRLGRAGSGYRILSSRLEVQAEALVITTPAPAAARLLAPLHGPCASILSTIPYSSTTIAYLAYPRRSVLHPLNGYGFVVPKERGGWIDACTWVSSKFEGRAPEDTVLLRCALHDGRRRRRLPAEGELVRLLHDELRRPLGLSAEPFFWRVYHSGPAMPQFTLGHQRRLQELKECLEELPGLYLSGAYLGGVGIPDCIAASRQLASRLVQDLSRRTPARPLVH